MFYIAFLCSLHLIFTDVNLTVSSLIMIVLNRRNFNDLQILETRLYILPNVLRASGKISGEFEINDNFACT